MKPLADDPGGPAAVLDRLDPRRISSANGCLIESASLT